MSMRDDILADMRASWDEAEAVLARIPRASDARAGRDR